MKTLIRQHPIQHDGGVYFLLTRVGDTEALMTHINNNDIEYVPKHYWKNAEAVKGLPKGKYVTAQYVAESIRSSKAGQRRKGEAQPRNPKGNNAPNGTFAERTRTPIRGASE